MGNEQNPYASPRHVSPVVPESTLRTDYPQQLRRVRLGLTLIYYAIVCTVLLVIGAILAMFLGLVGPGNLTVFVVAPAFFIGLALFVGECLCVQAPAEYGAKNWAIAAVVLHVATWLLPLVQFVVGQSILLSFLGNALSLALLFGFVVFMRQLAFSLNQRAVAGRANRTLFLGGIAVVLILAGSVLIPKVASPEALQITAGIGFLLLFATFLMFASTVTYLRKAIRL